jgi:hypothetical protein
MSVDAVPRQINAAPDGVRLLHGAAEELTRRRAVADRTKWDRVRPITPPVAARSTNFSQRGTRMSGGVPPAMPAAWSA